MGEHFLVRMEATAGRRTVVAAGEIDLSNAALFGSCLDDAVRAAAQDGLSVVDVDLSAVEFFGSEGVRCLVGAAEAATAAGCRLRVEQASPIVRRVLELTRLEGLLADDGTS